MTARHLDRTAGHQPLAPTGRSTGVGAALRWPTLVLLAVAGAVHLPVIPEHLEEAPYIGVLFIVLAAACFVLAMALAVRDAVAVWALTALTTGLAFVAYVLSRTVGLPQIGDDVGNWAEPLGVAALIAEGLAFVAAVTVLTRRNARRPGRAA